MQAEQVDVPASATGCGMPESLQRKRGSRCSSYERDSGRERGDGRAEWGKPTSEFMQKTFVRNRKHGSMALIDCMCGTGPAMNARCFTVAQVGFVTIGLVADWQTSPVSSTQGSGRTRKRNVHARCVWKCDTIQLRGFVLCCSSVWLWGTHRYQHHGLSVE
jgi:hypothetical protein